MTTAGSHTIVEDRLGPMLDVDSHEMAPTHVWGEMFGRHSQRFAELTEAFLTRLGEDNVLAPGVVDQAEITPESVWSTKGPRAPGSFDFDRRTEVLDVMGTKRQMVFPTSALLSFVALLGGKPMLSVFQLEDTPEVDEMLWGVIHEYNDWALRTTAGHAGRYRAAALVAASDVDDLMAPSTDLVERGAKALWLSSAAPPGGRSPADHDLDPFWAMLAEADVAAALHLGADAGFRATEVWAKALPEFQPIRMDSAEITLDPFTATTMQLAPINYLTAMVMGGVFERHPMLRFGVLELGSSWLGPLAEHLDVWAAGPFSRRMQTILTMPPSAYLARNVRVTPFYFEPIGLYLERHPTLQTSYCFSSDYPHKEGGVDARARYYESIRHLGDDVAKKFFVTNGEWLMPG